MARPSRPDGIVPVDELQPGMKVFTVVDRTIRDSLGAFCTAGQQAALNKADATRYHKLNLIQVELPDFDEVPDAARSADGQGKQAAADAGAAGGEAGAKPAANPAGREPSRRV